MPCQCVCERPAAEQNNTHPRSLTHKHTHLPSTVSWLLENKKYAPKIFLKEFMAPELVKTQKWKCEFNSSCGVEAGEKTLALRHTRAILICSRLYRAWLFINHIFQLVISKPASSWMPETYHIFQASFIPFSKNVVCLRGSSVLFFPPEKKKSVSVILTNYLNALWKKWRQLEISSLLYSATTSIF